MTEPLVSLSPEKVNSISMEEDDITWHEPPSSPFISHVEHDQENVPPADMAPTPVKAGFATEDDVPQSAFKISSPSKRLGLVDRDSPVKLSPTKHLLDDAEEQTLRRNVEDRSSPKKVSPVKQMSFERPESAMSNRSRKDVSPSKSLRAPSVEPGQRLSDAYRPATPDLRSSPVKQISSSHAEPTLRANEGLTVAMELMEDMRSERHESYTSRHTEGQDDQLDDFGMEDTEFNPDGPDLTALDVDDTGFSMFSEMPDMTKFAAMRKSPTKNGLFDQATPRARPPMTPSTAQTVRRAERTPSPTPRRGRSGNETTDLLLDFTAQFEAFSTGPRRSPGRGRQSPTKSVTESNLLSYIQSQRTPARGHGGVPSTPAEKRQLINLLDFELPPPPTPRSVPTVTIRELESLKSNFQSQISSLTASLSGKEAEVDSLVKAVSDAERRVGEAQEQLRDERSTREHAEAQMSDWKKKGEEVQKLLQDVQSELARNDAERESLLTRLSEAEKRAEDAETRTSELETRAIEAESKNVDMTTFIGADGDEENKKIYSEAECQAAIAEKVNEVARDLHAAYKAKHEKKIKALKDNYQRKADEKCKELRVQIIRLERQVEEAEKKASKDDTFSKVLPNDIGSKTCDKCNSKGDAVGTSSEDKTKMESMGAEIQNLKAKLAGLQSELNSLRTSHAALMQDLEAERVEKGELVAAAEQMLSMCGEKMEELQQEEMRKSTMGGLPPQPSSAQAPSSAHAPPSQPHASESARPDSALGGGRPASGLGHRNGATASGIAKPSGLRAPGGFGFQGGLTRSTSGGKSKLMSNIERMGGAKREE